MARISGVTIPNEKQIRYALQYVYGIGDKSSVDILDKAKVEQTVRVKDLTDAEVSPPTRSTLNCSHARLTPL